MTFSRVASLLAVTGLLLGATSAFAQEPESQPVETPDQPPAPENPDKPTEQPEKPPEQPPEQPDKPPAPAAKPSLELTATSEPAEVPVGRLAKVTVSLKNTGKDPVTLPKLAEDRQIVSFDVQLDEGKVFTYEKVHPSPYAPRTDWPTGELKPGESWELEVPFPAVKAGVLTITAHFGRTPSDKLESPPPHTTAAPLEVKLVASPEGGTDVSIEFITSMGPIKARLFPDDALGTSLHFARLILEGGEIEGKQRTPYYKGLTFHRVIRNFMIQGGCPQGTGRGDPGYSIPAEFAEKGEDGQIPEKLRHIPGRLSMARSGHKDSAGSQFYICVAVSKNLDGAYTCFGEVTRGMDVAYTISEATTDQQDKPLEEVTIETMRLRPSVGK